MNAVDRIRRLDFVGKIKRTLARKKKVSPGPHSTVPAEFVSKFDVEQPNSLEIIENPTSFLVVHRALVCTSTGLKHYNFRNI